MAYAYKVVGGLCVVALAVALPIKEARSRNSIESDLFGSISKDCLSGNSMSCVKNKLLSFFDHIVAKRSVVSLSEGVTVVKTPGAVAEAEGDSHL